jgi:hypothetical protein
MQPGLFLLCRIFRLFVRGFEFNVVSHFSVVYNDHLSTSVFVILLCFLLLTLFRWYIFMAVQKYPFLDIEAIKRKENGGKSTGITVQTTSMTII